MEGRFVCMMKKYFKLYTNCILVKGATNSIIYDLFLPRYYTIPTNLVPYFYELKLLPFDRVAAKKRRNAKQIKNVCNELIGLGYAHWVEEEALDLFNEADLKWDPSSTITYAVINSNDYNIINHTLNFLVELSTPAILVRHNDEMLDLLDYLNEKLSASPIIQIEVMTSQLNAMITCKKITKFRRLKTIWSEINVPQKFKDHPKVQHVCNRPYFKQGYPEYELYSKSLQHHAYFNRRLYIGPKGEIKNALECKETFGNILDLRKARELQSIIDQPAFQKYWNVPKELCDVCKDCEFRHMCIDNRLPSQREDGSWYYQQECAYNPYIAKWKGEKGYQSLKASGIVVNEKGCYKKGKKQK